MEGSLHLSCSVWCSLSISHIYHEQFLKPVSCFFMGWEIHGERLYVTLFPVILSHQQYPHLFLFKEEVCTEICFVFSLHVLLHTLISSACKTLPDMYVQPILPSPQLKLKQDTYSHGAECVSFLAFILEMLSAL